MSKVYTTEIASEHIPSDNPIHQRLLKAYVLAQEHILGDVLEVGCGEGRGIDLIMTRTDSYSAIDKIEGVIQALKEKYPLGKFINGNIPPLSGIQDNSFDRVVSFQVIEHIENDDLFLSEIHRVLKTGGKGLITTPNRSKSLSRNPWHIREYTAAELTALAKKYFAHVEMKGIGGNEKVMEYYERNRRSVERIMRFDIFDLQHRLPNAVLRVPYEWMNRWNRNKLSESGDELARTITHADYILTNNPEEALDLMLIVGK